MNQRLHRLVFNRSRGMTMPVCEGARSHGKAGGGRSRSRRGGQPAPRLAVAVAVLAMLAGGAAAQTRPPVVFAGALAAPKNALPQPYGSLRNATGGFVNDPALRNFVANPAQRSRVDWQVSPDGKSATFKQGDVDRVILNWDSFDIGAGHHVHFEQNKDPSRYVSALNRIWSADPSSILGRLTADREVILVNANGVYFGRGARVDTGKFVATANSLSDAVFERGLRNVTDGSAVFSTAGTDHLPTNPDAAISIEAGAEIRSAAGGDVLLIAPRVVNQGRIETPQGQAVLAAGDRVYLMSSSDPAQRGLIVAVDPVKLAGSTTLNDPTLGTVENAADGMPLEPTSSGSAAVAKRVNEIRADSGTVNLVGLLVRQAGQINATTAVKGANGVIHLQGMDSTISLAGGPDINTATSRRGLAVEAGAQARVAATGGTVEIAAGSRTAVLPSDSSATQISAEVFNPSRLRVEGETITVAGNATLQAPSGQLELLAASTRQLSPLFNASAGLAVSADGSRVVIAPGAQLSTAGLRKVPVDGARSQASQRLFRIELADAPVQQDGPLYRQEVFFDGRDADRIAVANVAGATAGDRFTAAEKATAGGTLRIGSEGTVVVGQGAGLDVSGGSVSVSATTLESSLLSRDGVVTQFRNASPGTRYDALLAATLKTTVPAYDEGSDGGTLELVGRQLAVSGSMMGEVVLGERQRDGTVSPARPSTLAVGRSQYLGGVSLVPTATAAIDATIFATPATADLSGLSSTTTLSLDAVSQGGFGTLLLRAARVEQPAFGTLDLGINGQLDILAKQITLDGRYTLPGGTVSLVTDEASATSPSTGLGDIRLSAATRFDAAGLWSNDTLTGGAAGYSPFKLDGGKVVVSAAHDVLADPGLEIDVSGGARLAGGGALSRGRAGSISLAAGRSDLFDTRLQIDGVRLSAHDFGSGGSLSLASPSLRVADSATPAPAGFAGISLDPQFFSTGGFGAVSINAFGDVLVAAGAQVEPTLSSWLLSPSYRAAPSGRMRAEVALPQPVDEALADRLPVNLSLAATRTANPGVGSVGGRLVVERGASITLEAGATLALAATGDVAIGTQGGAAGDKAKLTVPGGTLRVGVTGLRGASSQPEATLDPNGFIASQATWIGADAALSVAGTAELRVDRAAPAFTTFGTAAGDAGSPRTTGSVLGGGSIELVNQRGYVVLEQGSQLNLDGAAAALNLRGAAAPVTVARQPGRLVLASPEGMVLEGDVSARVPRDAAGKPLTTGGSLQLAQGAGGVSAFTTGPAYPDAPRQLLLGEFAPVLASGGQRPGDDLSSVLGNGSTRLPLALLRGAGFDSLRLGAGDRISFEAPTSLAAAIDITLDSPVLAAQPGVAVELAATTVSFGDRTLNRLSPPASTVALPDSAADLGTRLWLKGQTVQAFGRSALQGFSSVHLDAGASALGEVRFGAISPTEQARQLASEDHLRFAGGLTITSGQTFATTTADFTVEGLAAAGSDDPGSRILLRTSAAGAAPQAPLTAFGRLALRATDIDHQGILRQPFGAISLQAERSLNLGQGSLTSVSGAGQTLLYGSTDNLAQWLQPLFNDYRSALPREKSISLSAAVITTSPQARVDAAGGGTILASEFFAGVGGSTDYFNTPGLYAVLPDYGTRAPVSLAGELAGVDTPGRELVVTMPGSGLAPGAYTLLPARYALLAGAMPQGAFLVRRASDQGSVLLGAPLVQDDGGVVVTGSIRSAGSAFLGTPGERFVVEPAEVFRRRSEIRLTDAGALLARRADLSDVPVPALPADAGAIRIGTTGSERSLWQAQLQAAAAGGKAGILDISAARLALVDQLDKTPEAALGIAAASLGGSGAGSVLIGGLRSAGPAGSDGTPTSTIDAAGTLAVTVDLGTSQALQLEELILASSGTLSIAAGSRVQSKGSGTLGARSLALNGDGALAFVSANALTSQRTGVANTAGQLSVGAGSQLQGAFVGLDATARLDIDGNAGLAAGALSLGAPRIAVGRLAVADGNATTLDGDLLESVKATAALSLRSYSSIDFSGGQLWAQRASPDGEPTRVLDRLVLDAAAVRGLAGPDAGAGEQAARTDIAAREIALRNTTGVAATGLPAGTGSITLQALPQVQSGRTGGLTIGPGATRLAFNDARLLSLGDVVLDGVGGLTAQGDLSLQSARLTAGTAAGHALKADAGTLRIDTLAGGRTLGERVGQGATLSLSARQIVQDGRIELPSGLLEFSAAGAGAGSAALSFGTASTTSVAGFSVAGPDGLEVDGAAGRVRVVAGSGHIALLGRIDASAALRADGSRGEGDAGTIVLQAAGAGGALVLTDGVTAGQLTAHGGARVDDRGGSLQVDLRRLDDTAPLLAAVAAGGIDHELQLRSREGGVAIAGTVKAERIGVAADGGLLQVGGTLDARAASGGVVQLAAGAGVVLAADARIDARSTAAGARGGDVLLSAASGRISLAPGAAIDARGDDDSDGRIGLRALRSADGTTLQVDPLVASSLQAAEVNLEAVRVYRQVTVGSTSRDISQIVAGNSAITGTAGNLGQASVNADSTAYMATAAGALNALGIGSAEDRARIHLRAGVEVQAAGALTVGADWALNAARPGGEAGFLTLRAAGDLNINGSLSDGFASTATTAALLDSGQAWSYRLAAGADLAAAHPLAVKAADTAGAGSLTVTAGRLVRTGAGSIEMAAAQDLRFAAPSGTAGAGIAYVAGRRYAGSDAAAATALFAGQTARPSFTEGGGRLDLAAGRDVIASEATQLVNNWLWRSGLVRTTSPDIGLFSLTSHLGWWTEFSRFGQSLGAFGGSSIRVRAGRDVVNLQAMAPNAGWADNRDPTIAALRTIGGGDVDILAGRDVLAGQFLAGRGTARISALGGVEGLAANVAVDEPILAQMNSASWRVQARESVVVASSFNPTAVPVSLADNRINTSGFFYTWGGQSALSLRSSAGSTEYTGGNIGGLPRFGLSTGNTNDYFRVMPSSLELLAFGGNADLLASTGQGAVLFPGATAQLRIWADGLIRLGGASNSSPVLAMSDSASTAWPDFRSPSTGTGTGSVLAGTTGLVQRSLAGTAPRAAIHTADAEPVRLHAGDSILQLGAGTWRLPKAASFTADNDILNLRLETQHVGTEDRTLVQAGRNFTAGLLGLVELGGPGELDVRAGREVDLGASTGLRTIGNQKNANLPAQGASIRLAAATAATLDLAGFEAAYLDDAGAAANPRSAQYRDLLRDAVRKALADPSLDYPQAWAQFQRLPGQAQVALARQVVAIEFGAVYLEGPAPSAASVTTALNSAFDRRKADIIAAGEAALAAGGALVLPGREALSGDALTGYLASMRALNFSGLDIDRTVARRVTSLQAVRQGWRDAVATSLGSTAAALDTLAAATPDAPTAVTWRDALSARSGALFQRYQEQAMELETTSAAAAASDFGRLSLPMRLALFDAGFRAAELGGAGSFVPQPVWPGTTPVLGHSGQLEMTQSAVITERGGRISLVNPGGGINVGLKVSASSSAPKGVITLGGGDVYGYARDDFQVNTQRVFIVGQGDMDIWSSRGDIDSGRGANTAVGAPPLAPRRSVDGVVFEIPPTTTGSGLGIVPDIAGRAIGTIGLYPAFGEILALDAFIRAPSIVLGAAVQGADNLGGGGVSGAAAAVAPPPPAVSTAPTNTNDSRTAAAAGPGADTAARERNALLTVDLLGLGEAPAEADCSLEDERAGKCKRPTKPAAPADAPARPAVPADRQR